MLRAIKIYILKKLFLWWINEDNGRDLRGKLYTSGNHTPYVDEILNYLDRK